MTVGALFETVMRQQVASELLTPARAKPSKSEATKPKQSSSLSSGYKNHIRMRLTPPLRDILQLWSSFPDFDEEGLYLGEFIIWQKLVELIRHSPGTFCTA